MPSFSLFPKKSQMDFAASFSSGDTSPSRHSPSSSFSTMTGSTNSSVTNVGVYEYLPPIRSPSPLLSPAREKSSTNLSDYSLEEIGGGRRYYRRESVQKPLPDVPISIFDRLQAPMSFHPTRRAPLPPGAQSWIDLSEDDDEDVSYKAAPVPPHTPPTPTMEPQVHHLEKEIMRMLQFNEKEVERQIEEKKLNRRKSHMNFGGLMGKLRRSVSVRNGSEYNDSKRLSYFDYLG
jgi:hypothetical protein